MSQSDPAPAAGRSAAFRFIFACALMNAVSFGIMIPVLPNLIKQFAGGDTAHASEINVVFSVTWGLMQFFCGPILGMLSDRIGRRPVLLISFFGLAVDFLFMTFAPTLAWLFIGRIINGMTAASFSTANAYVADVTPPEARAKTFGMMGAAFSFGFLIGPVMGGFLAGSAMQHLLGNFALRLPFLVAGILTAINWLYGYFILPESLPIERRMTKFDWTRANPVGSLGFLKAHGALLGLATTGFLFQLSHTVLPSIFVLYAGYRYHWGPDIVGLTLLLTGLLGILVQTLLVGPVVARIGERGALLLGTLGGALGFALYGFAPNGWAYVASAPVFALINFTQPGLQGLMTRRVGPQEQGRLQGANQSLQGIASITGPLVFGESFAWAIRHDAVLHAPGLPIFISASLMLIAFFLAVKVGRPMAAASTLA
ncbi:TCR/Tet family MFS transporter [Phenylobacterium aquaticum]|uniref:TCR/Tet family MFS transporter n=1 Tax=Phenylobacterium aquaticum TaxID=1763816 RepID=UPI001F5DE571|nr:TCR/Tet family MFS transporter [Phenylobacterium aquaticum]MCI3131379.1 TCR/Tet family MFS transporter [Phenylobacterium aquaticum]